MSDTNIGPQQRAPAPAPVEERQPAQKPAEAEAKPKESPPAALQDPAVQAIRDGRSDFEPARARPMDLTGGGAPPDRLAYSTQAAQATGATSSTEATGATGTAGAAERKLDPIDGVENAASIFEGVAAGLEALGRQKPELAGDLGKLSQAFTAFGKSASFAAGMANISQGIAKMVNEGKYGEGMADITKGLLAAGDAASELAKAAASAGLIGDSPLAKHLQNTPFGPLLDIFSGSQKLLKEDATTKDKILGVSNIVAGVLGLNPPTKPAAIALKTVTAAADSLGLVDKLATGVDGAIESAQRAWEDHRSRMGPEREAFEREVYDNQGKPRPTRAPTPVPAPAAAEPAGPEIAPAPAPAATPTPVRAPTPTPTATPGPR